MASNRCSPGEGDDVKQMTRIKKRAIAAAAALAVVAVVAVICAVWMAAGEGMPLGDRRIGFRPRARWFQPPGRRLHVRESNLTIARDERQFWIFKTTRVVPLKKTIDKGRIILTAPEVVGLPTGFSLDGGATSPLRKRMGSFGGTLTIRPK